MKLTHPAIAVVAIVGLATGSPGKPPTKCSRSGARPANPYGSVLLQQPAPAAPPMPLGSASDVSASHAGTSPDGPSEPQPTDAGTTSVRDASPVAALSRNSEVECG